MSYNLINIMIPSYRRVAMLKTCIESALDTAKDVCFTICVNHQDRETLQFVENSRIRHICAIIEETNQPDLSHYYNKMYQLTPWRNALVSMIGDDMVFKSDNWDAEILDAFNARSGELIIYCNDGDIMGDKMCVNLFTSREVVRGQQKPFMCERYQADMIDFIWYLTGKYTSILQYRGDIVIEHRHNRTKPEEQWDDTFKRLVPLQNLSKTDDEMKYAIMYATICAGNLLRNRIGINPVASANPLFTKNTAFIESCRL